MYNSKLYSNSASTKSSLHQHQQQLQEQDPSWEETLTFGWSEVTTSSGYKRLRRAKFTPENTQCPVPTDQLDEWRQTTVRRPGQEDMIYTDNYPSAEPKGNRELFPGDLWKGETTFKLKATATSRQQASTTTRNTASATTPRTRATMKRAPTVEEQQVQAPSKVRVAQEKISYTTRSTKDKHHINTNGGLE